MTAWTNAWADQRLANALSWMRPLDNQDERRREVDNAVADMGYYVNAAENGDPEAAGFSLEQARAALAIARATQAVFQEQPLLAIEALIEARCHEAATRVEGLDEGRRIETMGSARTAVSVALRDSLRERALYFGEESDEDSAESSLQEILPDLVNADRINSLIADTNAYGWGADEWEVTTIIEEFSDGRDTRQVEAEVHLDGEVDDEKMFVGSSIAARLSFSIHWNGGDWVLDDWEVTGAEIDDYGPDLDDPDIYDEDDDDGDG